MMPNQPGGPSSSEAPDQKPFLLSRSTRTVFFFVVVLTLAGVFLARTVPIAVFPETNFPRVVIGVDNGVMPVEQMQVTVTKPIEDAVNSVPGLKTVRSTTSRGTAEISLFFDWNQDMFHSLQLVDAALSKVRQTLPQTALITTNRLTSATSSSSQTTTTGRGAATLNTCSAIFRARAARCSGPSTGARRILAWEKAFRSEEHT